MTTSAVISAEEKLANDAKSHFSASTASTLLSTAATGSAVKTSLRWREQCLLATSLPKIVETLGNEYQKPWRYITSFSTNKGDQSNPADFLNKLYKHKDDETYSTPDGIINDSFMSLKSDELSDISAKIELFKVLYNAQTDPATKGVKYSYVADIPIAPVTMGMRDLQDFNTINPITNITPGGRETSTHGFLPGADVSIDSFDWKYQGANPATVRNDISAQIVLGFSSFDQLSKVYTHKASDGKIYEYSALDLLGFGSSSPKMEKDEAGNLLCPDTYDPALVEVKAVLSLTLPNKSVQDPLEKIRIEGIEKKIKGIKEILYLTLIDHDFAIAQNGTFTLTLTYRARLEATLAQMRSNVVFSTSSGEYAQLVSLDQSIVASQTEGCNDSATYDLVGQRSTKLREAWKTSFQKFFNIELSNIYMTNNASTRTSQSEVLKGKLKGKKYDNPRSARNIWKMEYPRSSILSWLGGSLSTISQEEGPERSVSPTGDLRAAIGNITTDEDDQSDFFGRIYNITGRATNHVVNFILFGDILEIMMHRAMSKQNFLTTKIETGAVSGDFGESGKIKIISGPVRIKIDNKTVVCSISDIPISVEAFADFWYRNVISHEREVYSVLDFIRDISEELINKSFGESCAYGLKSAFSGRTAIKTGWVQIPGKDEKDPLLSLDDDWYDEKTGDILVEQMSRTLIDPDLKVSTPSSQMWNYIVLSMENTSDMAEFNGSEGKDLQRGIYHLTPLKGIVQGVTFSKTDQPYLRESRFRILGENPLVHLSNVYNVNISLAQGNNLFYPGQLIYINPISFGNSLGRPVDPNSISNVMGLGGYHIIMGVSHTWGASGWETEIEAIWDNNGQKETRCTFVPKPCVDAGSASRSKTQGTPYGT